jgi:hypothetical protein
MSGGLEGTPVDGDNIEGSRDGDQGEASPWRTPARMQERISRT